MFDVTTIGSTMLRLSVPPGERLETAGSYQVHTAGTESNTMVALARMGKKSTWISRLKRDSLGMHVERDIKSYGVDTSGIIWTDSDRNEVFFVEYGAKPRSIQVVYDRKNSAISNVSLSDIDFDFLFNTKIVHLTGILPALSKKCTDVTNSIIDKASEKGLTVSFDVNYRAKLWNTQDARDVLEPMMKKADILFLTREDARDIFDIGGTPEQICEQCCDKFAPSVSVVTLGGEGGIAYDGSKYYSCQGYDVEEVDRLGAGDCFSAGVLCGYLEGSLEQGMKYASAMAAIKMGIRGDYFASTRDEVMKLIDNAGQREVGR